MLAMLVSVMGSTALAKNKITKSKKPQLTSISIPKSTDKELISKAVEVLKLHEGFSSKVYKCGSKRWTQGYGRQVKWNKSSISKSTAEKWLREDIKKSISQLDNSLPWWRTLSVPRQIVMINMTYNLGIDKFLKFDTFLSLIKTKQFTNAANTLLWKSKKRKSTYARQTRERANNIAFALVKNVWPIQDMKEYFTKPG